MVGDVSDLGSPIDEGCAHAPIPRKGFPQLLRESDEQLDRMLRSFVGLNSRDRIA